ncbi:MAG: hypothetical protein LAQ30_15725 [Acidobacteriia bacterium]|nr:hypothetical protein [Terriglobia bacterium]
MRGAMLASAAVLFGTVLTGCGGYGHYYVGAPPPPPRYHVIGVAPGPGWVWTDGYWDRRGGRWFWVEGRWMRTPHQRTQWVPGRWEETRRGRWAFRRGHWR